MTFQPKPAAPLVLSGRDVTAVLGPTNTGKTHLAIERMVAHESGVIGLPLRLLAREVYGRVVEKVGAANVSLVTGEEKIVPPGARYAVCTVEAMPRETDAAFVAIDEVQLAADLERGHVFTDRILHLRGRQETLLLGAGTMRGILQKLLRGISVVTRPRMSQLAYAGSKKITRLPRRSAVVAFSADEVYAIAELIRRQRGGAAVVMGALRPRTRNAQVALYQSGDVDYLVATDAIGMGLNLDVDHVAFAQRRKFDGYQYPRPDAAELGQIAGRAGRHVRDGTFGVTGRVDPLEDELVERIEGHDFDSVKVLQWRTADFDFASIDALQALDRYVRAGRGTGARAARGRRAGARKPRPRALHCRPRRQSGARSAPVGRLRRSRLPQYRAGPACRHHRARSSPISCDRGHVDEDYMADQVRRADSTAGEIDTLSHRIAQIRTWTFVSHRPGWLADPTHWQEKTREIEDRLSDALHERLTKRFVDRRTSVLMKRLRENAMSEAEINPAGDVSVEGHHVGQLEGFRFTMDPGADGADGRAVKSAAQKALATEFERRAERFAASANGDFAIGSDGAVRWQGAVVASLVSTDDPLKPRARCCSPTSSSRARARDKVAQRLERFVAFHLETVLKPLFDLSPRRDSDRHDARPGFPARREFRHAPRREVAEDVRGLDQDARGALRRLGVRFGAYHIFLPALAEARPGRPRHAAVGAEGGCPRQARLWRRRQCACRRPHLHGRRHELRSDLLPPRRLPHPRAPGRAHRHPGAAGRPDPPGARLEGGQRPRPDGAYDGRAFIVTPAMMSILGATAEDMEEVLKSLGYRSEAVDAVAVTAHFENLDAAAAAATEPPEGQAEAPTDTTRAEVVTPEASQEATVPVQDTETAGEEPASPSAGAPESEASVEAPASDDSGAQPETGQASPTAPVPTEATDENTGQVETAAGESEPAPEEEAPKPVLLWRPARFEGRGRRPDRNRKSGGDSKPHENGNGAEHGAPKHGRGKNGDRQDRRHHDGQGDGDGRRNRHGGGKKRPDRDGKPARERNVAIDPNSPFAKLAALKDQLTKK